MKTLHQNIVNNGGPFDKARLKSFLFLTLDLNSVKLGPKGWDNRRNHVTTQTMSKLVSGNKYNRVLCVRDNRAGMSVTYRNKDGYVKDRNTVYSDFFMARYGANKHLR